MAEEASKMEYGTTISCDGSYAHGTFINCQTQKIVAWLQKKKEWKF